MLIFAQNFKNDNNAYKWNTRQLKHNIDILIVKVNWERHSKYLWSTIWDHITSLEISPDIYEVLFVNCLEMRWIKSFVIYTQFSIHILTRWLFTTNSYYLRDIVLRHCKFRPRFVPLQLGLYSPSRRRLTGIGIPIIYLRRSDDRLRFIMGIPILIRRRLLVNRGPGLTTVSGL